MRGEKVWRGLVLFLLLGRALGAGAEKVSHRDREQGAEEALALFQQGDYSGAREKWEGALAGNPSRSESRKWRPWIGRAYEAEGLYQEALGAFQVAYDYDPKSVDRMVDLARVYDVVELDEQAVRYYEEAHRRDSRRQDVSLALARLYLEGGRLKEAHGLAATAAANVPGDLGALDLLARIEEAEGALDAAGRRREVIMAQAPTAEGYLALGRLWARQDAFDQADLAFARAEKAGAPPAEVAFERAVLAWRKGERPKVILYLEEAERQDAAYFPARFVSAIFDQESGRLMSARVRMMGEGPPDPVCAEWKKVFETALERVSIEEKK